MMLRAILTAGVVFSGSLPLAYAQVSIPPGFEIIQLTQGPTMDWWPRINDRGQIVFVRRLEFAQEWTEELYLYEDGEFTRLTDDDVRDSFPDISSDGTITWSRFIGPDGQWGPTAEIMVRRPDGTITRLTDDALDDRAPSINSLNHIAWAKHHAQRVCGDHLAADIYFFDGQIVRPITTDGIPEEVANQSVAIDDSDRIVWTRYNFCPWPWESTIQMYQDGAITRLGSDISIAPTGPRLNNRGQVAWVFVDFEPTTTRGIELWENGQARVFSNLGNVPVLNDHGDMYFIRRHSVQRYQAWLYYRGSFYQLSDDFGNTDGDINNAGEAAWKSGPLAEANIRYLRRFSVADVNCDGVLNALDIEPFVWAMFDPDEYRNRYPACDRMLADINGDGSVNALDIEPFIELLFD